MFANAIINPYYFVDFCERDTCTRLLSSVGLAQAHRNDERGDHVLLFGYHKEFIVKEKGFFKIKSFKNNSLYGT